MHAEASRAQAATQEAAVSVHPLDGHPLSLHAGLLEDLFEGVDGLVDVVVDDGEVEEVLVRLLQQGAFCH